MHENLWSIHLYRYHGVFEWDRGSQEIVPGLLGIIPPGTTFRRIYDSANSVHVFALFCLEEAPDSGVRVPWFRMLGKEANEVNAWMEAAVGLFPLSPLRAAMRVWDVIWRFRLDASGKGGGEELEQDWLVDRFVQWAEQNLDQECTLHGITEAMGCSYTHLNKHVQARLGTSVKKYMRTRRMERVMALMKYTRISIKEVAASLGFETLQGFNQFVQREAGVSPRTLRNAIQQKKIVIPSPAAGPVRPRK